jgi:hypothetical protein
MDPLSLSTLSSSGAFSKLFGGVTSLKRALWASEDSAEKKLFSVKMNKRAHDITRVRPCQDGNLSMYFRQS